MAVVLLALFYFCLVQAIGVHLLRLLAATASTLVIHTSRSSAEWSTKNATAHPLASSFATSSA